ncbi:hypothetical protein Aazo_0072 ['Nostoc azollae' 0708]|jgi:hypothetical protein|uniref:Uncharacterized protein n=1 Tax=Nostoc azollae (strain 0708) TaxID=551115 RepID=D7DVB7_NOSA0|nr:hypothetical protein Aazo_0072 ['Nostoc azollae' 0708]
MSNQINKSNLVELTIEAQQLISGGYCDYSPCYKPPKCCGYKPYCKSTPYKDYDYSSWYS